MIPRAFIHREEYIVSEENLDLSSWAAIERSYAVVLRSVAAKLQERIWHRIYLVPTASTTLALQIKRLVYHITRLSTIDLFYSRGDYFEVNLDYRA